MCIYPSTPQGKGSRGWLARIAPAYVPSTVRGYATATGQVQVFTSAAAKQKKTCQVFLSRKLPCPRGVVESSLDYAIILCFKLPRPFPHWRRETIPPSGIKYHSVPLFFHVSAALLSYTKGPSRPTDGGCQDEWGWHIPARQRYKWSWTKAISSRQRVSNPRGREKRKKRVQALVPVSLQSNKLSSLVHPVFPYIHM